jgi:RNA polymerase sigma-70 factor, ECF subfamily
MTPRERVSGRCARNSHSFYMDLTTTTASQSYDRLVPTLKMESLSDEQIVEHLRGELDPEVRQELFGHIFRRYQNRVTFWCYRFTRDRETALDLAQDVFLKAYRRMHTFRSDAKLSTWLFTIARNHCIDAAHKRSSEPVDVRDLGTLRVPDPHNSNIARDVERKEQVTLMLRIVAGSLSRTEAKIMVMHYAHDMPINAVTAAMGLRNPSGAKAYIVSARRKLAPAVKAWHQA